MAPELPERVCLGHRTALTKFPAPFACFSPVLQGSFGGVLLCQFVHHHVVSALYCYRAALALYCCDVPSDVTVHTSNPAVELLHAL
jgi:hypothetical protein